ncbi:RecQ family ATP-dependent DNA helicase [Vallitalea sediminicola]
MISKNLLENMKEELIEAYGPSAEFREGQEEAIAAVLTKKRALVVQKTGWGKSLIYFLSTRILRINGSGPTIVISPLLALMRNQIDSAERFGLSAATINSANIDEWDEIEEDIENDMVDILFISPERLANESFNEKILPKITSSIGLLVIDEAHCISDWGHDFRPDYRRIIKIIRFLPPNVPLLATTATANNRVIEDVAEQIGDDILIQRGGLVRESIAIQMISLKSKEERLAWLAKNIPDMSGTGIVYCLTINDCKMVSDWLQEVGIEAYAYHSKIDIDRRHELESMFIDNKMQVLVATTAFGMGVDKPDIGFVVHFQRPANIVSYYQQIGRAGRAIDKAYAIMLVGQEDNEINKYFIDSAFPTFKEMDKVVRLLESHDHLRLYEIMNKLDFQKGRLDKCLKILLINGDIYKDGGLYYKSATSWNPDMSQAEAITAMRYDELKKMDELIGTEECYMKFIAKELNDDSAEECMKCSNCLWEELFSCDLTESEVTHASRFVKSQFYSIEPRKKWPSGVRQCGSNRIAEEHRYEKGIVLSNYGDVGWGKIVKKNKYTDKHFDDQLVEASAELLKGQINKWGITWVTSVSSLRHPELVRSFAYRLSEKLNLPYFDSIEKLNNSRQQKELQNSHSQYSNAYDSFAITEVYEGNVLLVDDMVDSRWTLTVCAYKLLEQGSGEVYPFALSNSAGSKGSD